MQGLGWTCSRWLEVDHPRTKTSGARAWNYRGQPGLCLTHETMVTTETYDFRQQALGTVFRYSSRRVRANQIPLVPRRDWWSFHLPWEQEAFCVETLGKGQYWNCGASRQAFRRATGDRGRQNVDRKGTSWGELKACSLYSDEAQRLQQTFLSPQQTPAKQGSMRTNSLILTLFTVDEVFGTGWRTHRKPLQRRCKFDSKSGKAISNLIVADPINPGAHNAAALGWGWCMSVAKRRRVIPGFVADGLTLF